MQPYLKFKIKFALWITLIITPVTLILYWFINPEDSPKNLQGWIQDSPAIIGGMIVGMVLIFMIFSLGDLFDNHRRNKIKAKIYKTQTLEEKNLQRLANSLLPLFNNMPRVPIRIVDEPIQKKTKKTDAYFKKGVIYIKREYLNGIKGRTDRIQELNRLMKHELVHAWMYWKGLSSKDSLNHGPIFQAKAKKVGCWKPVSAIETASNIEDKKTRQKFERERRQKLVVGYSFIGIALLFVGIGVWFL